MKEMDRNQNIHTNVDELPVCGILSEQNASAGYLVRWTVLLVLGLALEFVVRLVALEDNPLGVHSEVLQVAGGIAAVLVGAYGVYLLATQRAAAQIVRQRRGALLLTLGIVMVVGFFAAKQAVSLIF